MSTTTESKIEWTDYTFNPWRGCTKVSEGCRNCYAATLSGRNHRTLGQWGPGGTRVVAAESYWKNPLKWDREAKAEGVRKRVFCASLADVFEDWQGPMNNADGLALHKWHMSMDSYRWFDASNETQHYKPEECVPITMADVRHRLFAMIDATQNLDWLLLTKRPENVLRMLPPLPVTKVLGAYTAMEVMTRPNLWIGTSVENQQAADDRIPHLLRVPAAVRFLSCEPLLGAVDLGEVPVGMLGALRPGAAPDAGPRIDWVIAGGESGPGARPCHPDWVRSLRDQCSAAGVPFFFKQWGRWQPIQTVDGVQELPFGNYDTQTGQGFLDKGKKSAGRLLDGVEYNGMPEVMV